MDSCVRFWDSNSSVACSRYLHSKFLLRPNLKNLFDKLIDATKSLDLSKLPQLSTDGPNVNWDVLKLMRTCQEEKERPSIINIESCSLHIICGALQSGINSQNWELAKISMQFTICLKSLLHRLMSTWKFVKLIFSLCHKSNICFKKSCSPYYCSIT